MTLETSPMTALRATKGLSLLSPQNLLEHARTHDSPPPDLPPAIEAIWWDEHGKPERALQVVQDEAGLNAVWVRAYLRRKRGDETTAAYLYAKAIRPKATGCHQVERDRILEVLSG